DRMQTDPFGESTVRAQMHPGYQNPSCIGPSGPADPELSILSVQSVDERPIALLANYSMHYYGAQPVSADYYGAFCRRLEQLIAADGVDPPFVAMMSHGTSGDLHWMDYGKPKDLPGLERYADALARLAHEAWKTVEYHSAVPLAMAETKLTLDRRLPDAKRLAWAQPVLAKMGDRPPKTKEEVYAREALFLRAQPTRELILQAVRIGGLAITAIPCEVYGLTGLRLKALSPLRPAMNIELANGAEGYIPPPALHPLGGYNTWPARTAGLERGAEPKIVDVVLSLLEEVAGQPRREHRPPAGTYPRAVLASKPVAYWRMHEFEGPMATDCSGNSHAGNYEDFVVFYLGGPPSAAFSGDVRLSRSPHFAGGRMWASFPNVADTYSAELWFWNGLPSDARPVTGYMFSRGREGDTSCPGDHLGIGGTQYGQAKLLFLNGNRDNGVLAGRTHFGLRTWNHVVLVREGKRVTVYLNGAHAPEIEGEAEVTRPPDAFRVFVGGRCDRFANWEGRITEVALYDRALTAGEAAVHYAASGMQPNTQESW
ncbi:MAG: LamG domain-containing protein, partial [Dehalococcoidia bacterium]|nr:LamG domain-containing protein [Dehalococcoidia bacterium]